MTIEQIAAACHAVNRVFCRHLGDLSHEPWETAPEWQRESAIKGVRLHLADIRAGHDPRPERSHEAWSAHKRSEGWRYAPGPKDPDAKTHPCLLPFDRLPSEQQAKDYLFIGVVRGLAPWCHEEL